MSQTSKWEYRKAICPRYHKASKALRRLILNEFCQICGSNRKYAIRLLNSSPPQQPKPQKRKRRVTYGHQVISLLTAIWETAGYPCSPRLKALLPLWLPWAKKRCHPPAHVEGQILCISPATIDRRLKAKKRVLKNRRYGRTKPGTLLKHHIPIKTDCWDVSTPGFTEVDLVSHSGNSADGEFLHSLNMTDIHTTWVESRAVMGKGQTRVLDAMQAIEHALPFQLRGIDSEHGSAFLNAHLKAFCDRKGIQFTRGRPYKKDDHAHIEQKHWTHVRNIFGYLRYDSQPALEAMHELYRHELRLFQNLFLPSVKLLRKVRVGSTLKRLSDTPQTPFERISVCPGADPTKLAALQKLKGSTDPFELAKTIERKLDRISQMATHRLSPTTQETGPQTKPFTRIETEPLKKLSQIFGVHVNVATPNTPPHS